MKRRRPTQIAQPKPLELAPPADVRLLAAVLTLFDRAPEVYWPTKEKVLRQVAYAYGYRLLKREAGD